LVEVLATYRKLARRRPGVYRPYVADTLNKLGTVQRALNDLDAARQSFVEAIGLNEADAAARPTARLVERQGCWANLGNLYVWADSTGRQPDWHEARKAFRQARTCAESFRSRFLDPQQRQRVQAEALHVYERLVQTSVKLWEVYHDRAALAEAVETAEASRARTLVELLADETLHPANAPPDAVESFRRLRHRLRQAERRWLAEDARDQAAQPEAGAGETRSGRRGIAQVGVAEAPSAPRPAARAGHADRVREAWEQVQEEYQAALATIRRDYDPAFDPDQPIQPVTIAQARSLLECDVPTAIVQYCLTAERGLALLVTQDNVHAVPLPDLTDRDAWELAVAWLTAYYQRGGEPWDEALPRLLQPVSERAVRPVVEALAGQGIKRLILSPNRALHLFPLHAARLADGRYLGDGYEVVYTPSLSILHHCGRRRRPAHGRLFLVEDPTEDLAFTRVEGAGLRRRYRDHACLSGRRANRQGVLTEAGDCRLLHFSGHAFFDLARPLRSGLILGSKHDASSWLTLRDVFTELRMPRNYLTVVNGCESGMIRPDDTDELIGLPSGFLYAGAQCVLSTLWPVYDLSSALLMDHFHEVWRGDQGVAAALREAQCWLRDDIRSGKDLQARVLPPFLARLADAGLRSLCAEAGARFAARYPDAPPFASPVHWAPFTATGLAYPMRQIS
jgi:CHAT domain-containing protein